MLTHAQTLQHALEALHADVHIDGFTPDQIFYQLEAVTEERLRSIEAQITAAAARRAATTKTAENGRLREDNSATDEVSLEASEGETLESDCTGVCSETTSDVDSVNQTDANENAESPSEATSVSDEAGSADGAGDEDALSEASAASHWSDEHASLLDSEETASFAESDWACNGSSDVELLNGPADKLCEVLYGGPGEDAPRKQRKDRA